MVVTGDAGFMDGGLRYHCHVCSQPAVIRVSALYGDGHDSHLCHAHSQGLAGIVAAVPGPRTTTRDQLFRLHVLVCAYAFGVMKERNESYSTPDDALLNFRDDGDLGIIARMGDKRQRLRNWAIRGPNYLGYYPEGAEGALNAIADTVNYAILLLAYISEKQPGLLKPLEEVPRIVRTDE